MKANVKIIHANQHSDRKLKAFKTIIVPRVILLWYKTKQLTIAYTARTASDRIKPSSSVQLAFTRDIKA